jgi:hypothetical protein
MSIQKRITTSSSVTTEEHYSDDNTLITSLGITNIDKSPLDQAADTRQMETGESLPLENKPKNIGNTVPIGKTFPDLISEHINNPKIISLLLWIVGIYFGIRNSLTLASIKYGLIIGFFLNIIWGIIEFICWCIKKLKN